MYLNGGKNNGRNTDASRPVVALIVEAGEFIDHCLAKRQDIFLCQIIIIKII